MLSWWAEMTYSQEEIFTKIELSHGDDEDAGKDDNVTVDVLTVDTSMARCFSITVKKKVNAFQFLNIGLKNTRTTEMRT